MCYVISALAPSLQRSASMPGGAQPQGAGKIMYLLPGSYSCTYMICISPAAASH